MAWADDYTLAGKTAVLQNIQGTVQFLQQFAPFKQMENSHLIYLVEHCELRFYPAGATILGPEDGPAEHFYIVKQGRIQGKRHHHDTQAPSSTFEISTGDCFPLSALVAERATHTQHLAAEDTFCLMLGKPAFVELFSRSSPLRDFALRGVSSLLDQVNQQVQMRAVETLGAQYSLNTPLRQLAMHSPLSCTEDLPLSEAVKRMHEQHVGSIVVVDAQQRPLGIFTLRDLRRVVADGGALDQPIKQLMTPKPFSLAPTASAFDAALAMTERHIAHICLVDNQRLCGVISERDIFSLQRVNLVHLARTIRQAPNIVSLAELRSEVQRLVDSMLAYGASSTQITQLITLLNDHCVCRVIELVLEQYGDPGIAFTWMCFGSEGRGEQTLFTDQDNGLLFAADDAAHAAKIRGLLLPLAEQINLALAQCGFSLCKGQIMASNPQLCLSTDEWRKRFNQFMGEASANSLLAATIFFDLRAVWGAPEPVETLRQGILEQIIDNPLFQRKMAENALRHKPPVGVLRHFVLAKKGADKNTLDLKVQGLTPFVDAARVLALANGISACNTLDRLRALVAHDVIASKDAAAYEEAYQFIQQARMQQHQAQARAQQLYSNRIDPSALNHLDQRILRESFRQAQRLQSSLTLRYQL